jgi:hypothetical protein
VDTNVVAFSRTGRTVSYEDQCRLQVQHVHVVLTVTNPGFLEKSFHTVGNGNFFGCLRQPGSSGVFVVLHDSAVSSVTTKAA